MHEDKTKNPADSKAKTELDNLFINLEIINEPKMKFGAKILQSPINTPKLKKFPKF